MKNVYRDFTVEDLEEKYDLPYEAVSDEEVDKHRWYTTRDLVFKAEDGNFYAVIYMDPATEMQEDQDRWDTNSHGVVTGIQVEEKEVTTTKWVEVKVNA